MQDKIKAQLRAKLNALGVKNLSQARIDVIADKLSLKITDESEIDAKLDELNEIQPFAEIAKFDDWQRARDNKRNTQQQQQQSTTQSAAGDSTDEPDLKAMFAELKSKLETMEKEKQTNKLQETLLKKVSEKKIPASFVKGRTIESEDQLDSVLQEIETDFTAVKQELVNQGFSQSTTPIGGVSTIKTDSVDKDIEAWAKKNAIPQTKNN
jgi:membrane-bound lytic murein transglycosylase B